LQDARDVETLLAAASLLVLPSEESAHWHKQKVHRAKRRGAASRALVRLAKWLAPESNLGPHGAREACVTDARFKRLVEAAACAYVTERNEETVEETVETRDDGGFDFFSDAELDTALDAFRALGSLAPFTDERIVHNASLIGARVAFGVESPYESVSSSYAPPKHAASVGSWACSRLSFKSGSSSDPAADSLSRSQTEKELRERIVKAFREASRSTPFRVLPNLLRSEWSDFDETDDDRDETIEANVAGGWTSAADILANAKKTETTETKEKKKNVLLLSDLTVKSLAAEVPFKVEQLVTRDGTRVDERRETCWMADEGIGGLAYSGKVMAPTPFTPLVDSLRDLVHEKTGQRFDCALLNLYPERSVACKYHKDPDLGRLWARDSVIVSVGETRRFAFREETGLPLSGRTRGDGKQKFKPEHWFRVFNGDAIWMFGDCNDTWEHCVMPGEIDGIDVFDAPRASVVFKRSLAVGKGGGTRGHAVTTRVTAPRGPGAGNRNRRGGGSNPARGGGARGGARGGRGRGRNGLSNAGRRGR
jgi:alkylated DNA repair dioxygenase AlkB